MVYLTEQSVFEKQKKQEKFLTRRGTLNLQPFNLRLNVSQESGYTSKEQAKP